MFVTERFKLKDSYEAMIRTMKPMFGYGLFGEVTYYRSYSRMVLDSNGKFKKQEHWPDTVLRVINGVMSLRKDWYTKNYVEWKEDYWQGFAFNMAQSLFRMEWLPPGRGLWAMGTDLIYERGSMALYNCCFTKVSENWIIELCWLMDCLMHGCGVGFKPERNDLRLIAPSSEQEYLIPDNREGWVEGLRKLLASFSDGHNEPLPAFNYSLIRPAGALIKTFGGIASGPEPLKAMYEKIKELLYRYLTYQYTGHGYDEVQLKVDLANLIGICVVTGNVRRSAEIALCEMDDPTFMDLKNYEKYPERATIGWMSNNSVILSKDEDYENLGDIAAANANGYDVGYLNLRNFPYGRIGKDDGLRYDNAIGCNPCQPCWAWVLTVNGLRQFKDVKVGDRIWSETGWVNIVNKFSTGVKKVYKYHTTAGTFYGTENHELVSEGFKAEARLCTDIDILVGPKNETIGHGLEAVVDGLVLGDGSFVGDTRVVLNIGQDDQDYFTSLKDFIGEEYNKSYQFIVKTTIQPSELCHPSNRFVPENYLTAGGTTVCSFLRGLFSANGSIVANRVTLKTTSIQLVEHVQMMLSSVGLASYYTTNKPTLVKHHNGHYKSLESYDINISDTKNFEKYIGFVQEYKMTILRSLNEKKKEGKKKTTFDIVSIEFVSEEMVYDITVDNSTHTYWTQGLNVSNCGEINLEPFEVCNVVETLPTRCVDVERWIEACGYATFYASTVSLLPTHSHLTNRIVSRNRRIGVSIIDFTGWKEQIGVSGVTSALRMGYDAVRETNKRLADEAGVPASIRCTTVKPGGTVPKIAGRTAGAGHPTFKYTLRRIRIQQNTELERILVQAGVPREDDVASKMTSVFEFPIIQGPACPATEVSIWEQAMNLVLLQREWADNMVSNTLYFKPKWSKYAIVDGYNVENQLHHSQRKDSNSPDVYILDSELLKSNIVVRDGQTFKMEKDRYGQLWFFVFNPNHEEDDLEAVLSAICPLTKSVSLLPHSDIGIFKQMPEEGITVEEYDRRVAALKNINWSTYRGDGEDEKYCSGASCEVIK